MQGCFPADLIERVNQQHAINNSERSIPRKSRGILVQNEQIHFFLGMRVRSYAQSKKIRREYTAKPCSYSHHQLNCASAPTPRNNSRAIRATMMKLRCPNPKRLFRRSSSKISSSGSSRRSSDDGSDAGGIRGGGGSGEIEWEVRPGGMLVQRRDGRGDVEIITVRVATGYSWNEVSIGATCTFGELKVVVSMVTGLAPREQRLLFRGKEREDSDHLHMVGVRDKDKVLLLEDPALKDIKLRAGLAAQAVQSLYQTFIKV